MTQTKGNKSLLKPTVSNLTNQEIPQHHLKLRNLDLRPKFVLSSKKLRFMNVLNVIELCALSLEKENQIEKAVILRQNIGKVIYKNINFEMRSN